MPDFDDKAPRSDEDITVPIDLFSDEDEPVSVAEKEAAEEIKREFTFDRYGRRQYAPTDKHSKKRKEKYGKRKDMPKAETLVVVNETAAQKDIEEAEKRAKIRDEQRQKVLEKELQKKRRQQKFMLKRRLTVIGMILLIVCVLALAAYFIFRLQNIRVIGTYTRYTQEQIVANSELTIGKHMLQQDLDAAKESLENDPYISATVDYVFPNSIQIMIVERTESAAVRWGLNSSYIAIIDGNGVVLNENASDTHGLIEVHGLVLTGAVVKQRIGERTDEQVSGLLEMLEKINEYGLGEKLQSIDITETMGITLYTVEGYRVEVGSTADLDTKLNRLNKYWNTIIATAARYVSQGNPNPTIYLYSKNGVTVSPYAPDYVVPSNSPDPTNIPSEYDPNATTPPTPDPNAPASQTPNASSTPIPYISDPYYG